MIKQMIRSLKVCAVYTLLDKAVKDHIIQDFQVKCTSSIIQVYLSDFEGLDTPKYVHFRNQMESIGFVITDDNWYRALL